MENMFDIIERETAKDPTRPVVVIGHIQPDGDCVGSSLGMKYLLRENYGIEATVVNQPLKRMEFLGDWVLPGNVEYGHTFVIHVDNSVRERSADPDFINAESILKVDHHIVTDSYGDWNIEPQLSSCCEIIAQQAIEKGLRFSKEAARALYTGMCTDTGRFLYAGVNGQTLRVAAALLDTGFDMGDTQAHINLRTMDNVNYTAYCYSQIKESDRGVIWMYITQDVIDRFNLTPDQVSSALSTMRDIKDHPIFVLFADLNGKIRVEFRSDRVFIQDVAVAFGGGGHPYACGARLSTADDIPAVIRALEKKMPR